LDTSSTFPSGRPAWLDRLGHVRNVVRQEVITRHLARHLPPPPGSVLDVGAGQGTQSMRLAQAGHDVFAVEPDPEMRTTFASQLEQEPRHVQARVDLVAGGVEDLSRVAGGRRFDVVLLLGVLMYLRATEPVIAEIARHTRPGGVAVLAVRTTTSALWRPAARQDWVAARAAFEEADRAKRERRDVAYVNELGTPTRAVDLDELVASAGTYGLLLERWYGVRIAVDPDELDPPPPDDPGTLSDLIDVEERLGATDPFRHLGQLALVVFRA
jgi:S-adenosylmethionine-dependent methyltransferase